MERLTQIPQSTIQRLPVYLRCLLQVQAVRMPVINSIGIAEMCGTNAAQVRKDLSCLGELGIRGTGYDVEALIGHISRVLGITERRRAAIVGFGKLGGALLGYSGFGERGFEIVAVFDVDPAKIGTVAGDLIVRSFDDLETVLAEEEVEIVIMATPPATAQAVASRVVAAGIRAILNLAPINLDVPEGVIVRQVCLSTDLQILSFYLAQGGSDER
ncbi:MAG: redox-sensing transcriptional repressor Rex [Actinomycetota bacterium]|nr:MAG: redox-sensing transcriptional [Actinomycetota bacterium]MDO8950826.1 redox-sensing transcriptional repressor Rex [Actinomycetota bacterium]MDP3629918.1 redox-sensing transcriptional repressor Rex [Actinomycetota bacterium]